MILYLHGFRSSPSSFKSVLLGQMLGDAGRAADYLSPQLPASPALAIGLALKLAGAVPADELTLVGSSLGGYYATWLAEKLGCRAVLLNPAVKPPRELARYVGVSTVYQTGEPFEFKAAYIEELQALAVPQISRPERYFLLAATGDEVLDWREMTAFYQGARQHVIEGSDHGISDFARHADSVLAFCDARAGGRPDGDGAAKAGGDRNSTGAGVNGGAQPGGHAGQPAHFAQGAAGTGAADASGPRPESAQPSGATAQKD